MHKPGSDFPLLPPDLGAAEHPAALLKPGELQNAIFNNDFSMMHNQSEEALRESEAFTRSIIKSSPDCIKVLDLEGNLLSIPSGQALLGIEDIQPFLSTSWIEFWQNEHRLAAQAAVTSARGGEAGNFVGYFRTFHGEPKWWDVAVSPILDVNGQPKHLLAVSRDVTKRRQAELNSEFLASVSRDLVHWTSVGEMMQSIGAKMAAHFQLSLCAFAEINETAEQVVINHDWHREDVPSLVGVFRLADFVEAEFIRLARAGEVIVVRNAATDARTDAQKLATLKIASFICAPLIQDGQWRFALCLYHAAVYDWREDEIELVRELSARIWTRLERLRAEAALRKSEQRYRTLFESIDEGFCLIEKVEGEADAPLDFRYVEANPAFEVQSGLRDVVGKTIRQLLPGIAEEWFLTYDTVLCSGESIRFEREFFDRGRVLELYAFRVEAETQACVAVIFKDITARKQSESNLNKAIAVAEKSNLAKSDFLSGMSHELRTPLNAILGFAQLMQSGTPLPTPSQNRSLEQILKGGWYLLDLINEILDLALIESGKVHLVLEPVSLAQVLLECRAMIEPQAQARGVELTFPQFEVSPFIKVDRTRLKQVLINLLSNAVKYNKPAGAVVVEYTLNPPDSLRICIQDSGAGLAADQLAQLFQPFNRLGKEFGTEEGTGIGLVVTKRLVELMGGVIDVESTVGVGSVFWVDLPQADEAPAGDPKTVRAAARPRLLAGAALRTLLYVEDNTANLDLIEQLIARRPDMRLLAARDGANGIALARAHRPDVILMDVNLPGISGIQALKILREDALTAHIPVLAISANVMAYDIQNGLEAGFMRYLTKPIKVDEFMQALDQALALSATISSTTKPSRFL